MSHYHAEVWIPEPTVFVEFRFEADIEKAVYTAMAPHREIHGGDGFWDWYMVGGRYTGSHDPSYDPEKDKRNIEANGKVRWPTKWVRFTGDIMEVKDLPESLSCYTLMTQGHVFQHEIWNGDNFIDGDFDGLVIPKLKELDITRGYLVTIDYHS